MKIKSKAYAQALADIVFDKKVDEKKVMNNFLKLLEKNGDMKKAGEIMLLAENLFLKKTGNKKVILETARKTDTESVMKSFIKKGDVVQEKINPALVAGIKIIINGEKQINYSLSSKLNKII